VHEGEVDATILCQRLDIEETSIEAKLVVLELLREGEDMLVGGMCYEGELRELARTRLIPSEGAGGITYDL